MADPLVPDAPAWDVTGLPQGGGGRLAEGRRLIDEGAVSVLSLDVFDTLLWRAVPRPTDAFLLLGHELAGAGSLQPWVDPSSLRRLRIAAEARARARRQAGTGGTEVSLEEIWAEFPPEVLTRPDPVRMADIESALERRITYPDLDVTGLAAYAAERHCEVVLVSNTYFSARRLARLVARPELEVLRGTRLFPSCGFGVHKANGLWKLVLEMLDVPPARLLHVGDEALSDVEVPSGLGIRTLHYQRSTPATEAVLRRDGALPPEPAGPSPLMVHPVSGDFGLTGLRAKVAGRLECADLAPDLAAAWHFGATVLGPVLTGFAEWVWRRATELGAVNVWCMMREGEFLADLVGRVAAHRAVRSGAGVPHPSSGGPAGARHGLAARPIWLSRHVTARACLAEADEEELRGLLVRRMRPTVGQYLSNLGLLPGEVPEWRHLETTSLDQPEVAAEVIGALAGSDHLRARILAESARARKRLLAYLDSTVGAEETGADPGPVVLVDVGWGGTIQHQLATVMRMEGMPGRLVGLYLATNEVACDRILDGLEIDGFLTSCGTPEYATAQVGRSPEVVEQACLATRGSVLDFSDGGVPILDSSLPPPAQVVSKLVTQHGVRAFLQEWLRYDGTVAGWPALDGRERPMLLEILRASVTDPTATEARTFGLWTHEDNFGAEHRERIVPDRLGPFVPYLSPPDLVEMTMRDAFWPMGLAAGYDPGLAAATRAVIDGQIAPCAFEPARRPAGAELRADTGSGWGAPVRRPLRTNRNGLSYLRFVVERSGIQALRLDPCDHPAMFCIDWIDLTLDVRGAPEARRVRIQDEAELAGLVFSGCRWLYDGVAVGWNDDPQIHVPLAGRVDGDVYRAEVQVALSVLALPTPRRAVDLGPADFGTRLAWTRAKIRSESASGGLRAVGRGAWRIGRRGLGGL
ncbi:MAG: HAD family hydrolase [Acidimicrobiales bacterium]